VGFQPLAIKLIDESIYNFLNSHLPTGAGRLLAHVVGLLLAVALAGLLLERARASQTTDLAP
jgi:hypothetical protein